MKKGKPRPGETAGRAGTRFRASSVTRGSAAVLNHLAGRSLHCEEHRITRSGTDTSQMQAAVRLAVRWAVRGVGRNGQDGGGAGVRRGEKLPHRIHCNSRSPL